MRKIKVALFTGNRAEYGLWYPILRHIANDERFEYYLFVSGAHLKNEFGNTLAEIEKDGFRVYREVKINTAEDDLLGTVHGVSSCMYEFSNHLAELKPDWLVVYADRFESFGALLAGTQMGIPTAHIEGGDYTEGGALDDSVRHAMTKMAHIHFTTNEPAKDRVLAMGEEAWRVFNVGSPSLDMIYNKEFAPEEEVVERLRLDLEKPVLIFTQHSIATEVDDTKNQIMPSLNALKRAAQELSSQVIITYPNDDAGGKKIIQAIHELEAENIEGLQVHKSLGRYLYHGVLNIASAYIGNSSSGIKETPGLHCPCINIGARQKGRLRADNILEVDYVEEDIYKAIRTALFDERFLQQVKTGFNPYGAGNAGQQISDILAKTPLDKNLIQKKMTY